MQQNSGRYPWRDYEDKHSNVSKTRAMLAEYQADVDLRLRHILKLLEVVYNYRGNDEANRAKCC